MTKQQLQLVVEFLESYADNRDATESVEPWLEPLEWTFRERRDFLSELLGHPTPDTFHISNGEMARYLAEKILGEMS